MDLLLKNETTGEVREVKNGSAYYMIWQFFIPLVALVISVIRKQFKAWLSLTLNAVIGLVIYFVLAILTGVTADSVLGFIFGLIFYLYLIAMIVYIFYITITTIMNLNYWSYNEYVKTGYLLQNEADLGVLEFVAKAETKERPFWLFFL